MGQLIRRWMLGVWMVAGLLLPVAGAAAAPVAVGADTPEQAVTILLEPFFNQQAQGAACNAVMGKFADCPITKRLLNRLGTATENGNIVSRSQNPPESVAIKMVDNDGQTAHVATVWVYGAASYSITFTVVKEQEGWLVDDSFCTGDPSTSIFNPPTGPCTGKAVGSGSGGTNVPGMPATGQGADWWPLAALLVGALALASGLALREPPGRQGR